MHDKQVKEVTEKAAKKAPEKEKAATEKKAPTGMLAIPVLYHAVVKAGDSVTLIEASKKSELNEKLSAVAPVEILAIYRGRKIDFKEKRSLTW